MNVGTPVAASGREPRAHRDRHAVDGPVAAHTLGLEGDQVADTEHHGGVYQAVYAFAREDLDAWGASSANRSRRAVRREPHHGGHRRQRGGARGALADRHGGPAPPVEVRIPCNDFKGWLGLNGYDDAAWVRRSAVGRPGPYLRVLEEGILQAGDEIVVEHRPEHDVTVSTMFRAFTTDRPAAGLLGRRPAGPGPCRGAWYVAKGA